MKYWFEWGDIDDSWRIYYSQSKTVPFCYGPYKTFSEAKQELLHRFICSRNEIEFQIFEVKRMTAKKVKAQK